MKLTRWIAFSICLNVLLAAALLIRSNRAKAVTATAEGSEAPAQAPFRQLSVIQATSSSTEALPIRWSDLESIDLRQYAANLRKVGCPPGVLHDIISDEIRCRYRPNVNSIVAQVQNHFYEEWAKADGKIWNVCKPQQEQLEELQKAVEDVWEAALVDRSAPECPEAHRLRRKAALLELVPNDYCEAVIEVEARFEADRQKLSHGPGAKERLTELDKQHQRELIRCFGETIAEELRLRRSPGASLIEERKEFDATADEWRQIVGLNASSDIMYQTLLPVLGEIRASEFRSLSSETFREFAEIVVELGLPKQTTEACHKVRQEFEKQAQETKRQELPESILQERAEFESAQAREALGRLLGEDGAKAYEVRHGAWLR